TVDEMVLSIRDQPGLSGAAVIGRQDGVVHGILRGTFSPPEVMRVGHIPITTDISVTIATSAYYLHDMLRTAKEALEVPASVNSWRESTRTPCCSTCRRACGLHSRRWNVPEPTGTRWAACSPPRQTPA